MGFNSGFKGLITVSSRGKHWLRRNWTWKLYETITETAEVINVDKKLTFEFWIVSPCRNGSWTYSHCIAVSRCSVKRLFVLRHEIYLLLHEHYSTIISLGRRCLAFLVACLTDIFSKLNGLNLQRGWNNMLSMEIKYAPFKGNFFYSKVVKKNGNRKFGRYSNIYVFPLRKRQKNPVLELNPTLRNILSICRSNFYVIFITFNRRTRCWI